MKDTIRFGLSGNPRSMLSVNIPTVVLERMDAGGAAFKLPKSQRARAHSPLIFEQGTEGGLQATVLNRRIGRLAPEYKYNALRQVVSFIEKLSAWTDRDERDPAIDIDVGSLPINKGERYGLDMTIAWPDIEGGTLSRLATTAMIGVATDLRYFRDVEPGRQGYSNFLRETVGAVVEREDGVQIIALAGGSSTVDTDGDYHRPDKPQFEVYGHNLYSNEMQLICMVGGVAIAHADELV
ncbi:MAG: hypothetical protein WC498_02735 [Candidatus Saccharimonadales bacterium]